MGSIRNLIHVTAHVLAFARRFPPVKSSTLLSQPTQLFIEMSKFVVSTALKELRFHLSQTGEASVPLRNFLVKNYAGLKSSTSNKLPILIRESFGVPPSITARFEKGKEVKSSLDGLDEKAVEDAVKSLLK